MYLLHLIPDIRLPKPQNKGTGYGRCLSSVHHPVIDQRYPSRKADAKVGTFYDTAKQIRDFFRKKNYTLLYI